MLQHVELNRGVRDLTEEGFAAEVSGAFGSSHCAWKLLHFKRGESRLG